MLPRNVYLVAHGKVMDTGMCHPDLLQDQDLISAAAGGFAFDGPPSRNCSLLKGAASTKVRPSS